MPPGIGGTSRRNRKRLLRCVLFVVKKGVWSRISEVQAEAAWRNASFCTPTFALTLISLIIFRHTGAVEHAEFFWCKDVLSKW